MATRPWIQRRSDASLDVCHQAGTVLRYRGMRANVVELQACLREMHQQNYRCSHARAAAIPASLAAWVSSKFDSTKTSGFTPPSGGAPAVKFATRGMSTATPEAGSVIPGELAAIEPTQVASSGLANERCGTRSLQVTRNQVARRAVLRADQLHDLPVKARGRGLDCPCVFQPSWTPILV